MMKTETSEVMSADDRATLLQLEEAMWIAATRYDPAFQERYFAHDFFEFGRSGRVYSRAQIFRTGGTKIDAQLPLENFCIRVLAPNVVQLTYNSHVAYDGVVEHGRRSSIWSRGENGWEMRFHQGTPYTP